jgi:hypothetical protein
MSKSPTSRDDTRRPGSGGAEAGRLREDIDRGGTGDKVAFSDPSAAPLGTDDEAAGTAPTAEQVRTARAAEAPREASAATKATPGDLQGRAARRRGLLGAGLGVLVVLLVLFLLLQM